MRTRDLIRLLSHPLPLIQGGPYELRKLMLLFFPPSNYPDPRPPDPYTQTSTLLVLEAYRYYSCVLVLRLLVARKSLEDKNKKRVRPVVTPIAPAGVQPRTTLRQNGFTRNDKKHQRLILGSDFLNPGICGEHI